MRSIALFDLGDVVADFDPAPRLAELARLSGLSATEVTARLSADGFWRDTDRGRYDADEMHEQICARLGCRFTRAELLRLQALAFTPRPELVRLAVEVSTRTRVGILTNNAPLLKEAFPVHFPELARVFAPILYSFELGSVKPERTIFERAAARLAIAVERIFFVDDQAAHVAAAREAGWDAVQYESTAALRRALADRGLLGVESPEQNAPREEG